MGRAGEKLGSQAFPLSAGRSGHSDAPEGRTLAAAEARIGELERLLGQMTLDNDFLKSLAAGGWSVAQKYALMAQKPPEVPTRRACELLQVARSGPYRARTGPSPEAQLRAAARVHLRDRLEALCLEFPGAGYRTIREHLRREGWTVRKALVQTIMREESLQCHIKCSWIATTQSAHGYRRYPNLAREFPATGLNRLWVADITYIRLQTQFVYLAVLLDSFSRRVVGWELADTLEAQLCVTALERALAARQPKPEWVHHSDQGGNMRALPTSVSWNRPRRESACRDGATPTTMRKRRAS